MDKKVLRRKASDNVYLHKDFHCALNCGIRYLQEHFGDQAVIDYLRAFTRSFYAPLKNDLIRDGLAALERHFQSIYTIEETPVDITRNEDELVIRVPACPAVTRMRERGEQPSPLFVETTRTVNQTLCENTPFVFELEDYDPKTGAGTHRFRRRQP